MKRKAIIIYSHDVEGEKLIPGAKVDSENWKNFLRSDLGGRWDNDEIIVLEKPIFWQVSEEMIVSKDTYLFVAFSGHGSLGSICLHESSRAVAIEQITPRTEKGVLIIDSCRGFSGKAERMSFSKSASQMVVVANSVEGLSSSFPQMESSVFNYQEYSLSQKHKVYWDSLLGQYKNGVAKMYSCSPGQGADEDPEAGGYYTSLLLQAAENIKNRNTQYHINTKEAHDYASNRLPANQQRPVYEPTDVRFPFAVTVPR